MSDGPWVDYARVAAARGEQGPWLDYQPRTPSLPPGFVLDHDPPASMPRMAALPPGFVLDVPPQQAQHGADPRQARGGARAAGQASAGVADLSDAELMRQLRQTAAQPGSSRQPSVTNLSDADLMKSLGRPEPKRTGMFDDLIPGNAPAQRAANPFDRFDPPAQQGNPFDRFDHPSSASGARRNMFEDLIPVEGKAPKAARTGMFDDIPIEGQRTLVPVDHDPFATDRTGPTLIPVDHDPFADPHAPKPAVQGGDWPKFASIVNGMMNGAGGDIDAVRHFLGHITLSGMVKGLYEQGKSAATLPRDVYEGRVDPLSDEAIRRGVDFAAVASPMTPAARGALAVPATVASGAARDAADLGVTLTAGQRTGDPALLSTENAMHGGAMGAPAQRVAQVAVERQRGQIADARAAIGDTAGRGLADLERPADAGEAAIQGVRREAAAAKTDYQNRYSDAFAQDGSLDPRFFTGHAEPGTTLPAVPGSVQADFAAPLSKRITDSLVNRADPVIVDQTLTPAAHKALGVLDDIANLRLGTIGQPGTADDVVGINLRGVDQARRQLAAYGRAAGANPADSRAVSGIVEAFDREAQDAMERGLFSGSDAALDKLRDARAAFSSYQKTFKPQGAGDDVGRALQAITERDATPEQVANYLYGAAKTGANPLSVRLAGRLKDIVGEQSPEWAAIRQGAWQRVTGPADMGAKRSADRILDFVQGDGKSLATRLFNDDERAEMVKFANVTRAIAARPGTVNASNSGNRLAGLARQSYKVISGMLGAAAGASVEPMIGGTLGAGAGYALGKGAEQVGAMRAAGQAQQLFSGDAPVSIGRRISDSMTRGAARSTPRVTVSLVPQIGPPTYRAAAGALGYDQ